MGLFKKILGKLPGSPAAVAKAMLTKYNDWRAMEQQKGHDPGDYVVRRMALRYSLQTRYQLIKGMNDTEMEDALSAAGESLFALVLHALMKENPLAFEPRMHDQTIEDLYAFFRANAPEQIQIFEEMNS